MIILKWLRDPVWQFVLGSTAIFVTVIIFFFQQPRKEISYEIIQQTPLFSVNEQVGGKIQVLFNGNPVEDVYLLVVKVYNSGNIPTVRTDFDEPMTIQLQKDTEIISTEVLQEEVSDIKADITFKENTITILPTLINSNESIKIKAIINRFRQGITINARIIGVGQIIPRDPKTERSNLSRILGLTGLVFQILGIAFGLGMRILNIQLPKIGTRLMMIVLMIGFVLMFIGSILRI